MKLDQEREAKRIRDAEEREAKKQAHLDKVVSFFFCGGYAFPLSDKRAATCAGVCGSR